MANKPKKKPKTACGYKKPPIGTRFKKGRSGNPAGRPKGTPNLATALNKTLRERVPFTADGVPHTMNKLEASVKTMVHRAIKGDARAMQQVIGVMRVMEAEAPPPVAPDPISKRADEQILKDFLRRIGRQRRKKP